MLTKDVHTSAITPLIIIASNWEQSTSSKPGEWAKRLQFIPTMEYYSAVKRNALLIQQGKIAKLLC